MRIIVLGFLLPAAVSTACADAGAASTRLRDMILCPAVDYRRALDYLEARPEIDAKRIGAVGFSMAE